jgi:hypothetical protein
MVFKEGYSSDFSVMLMFNLFFNILYLDITLHLSWHCRPLFVVGCFSQGVAIELKLVALSVRKAA